MFGILNEQVNGPIVVHVSDYDIQVVNNWRLSLDISISINKVKNARDNVVSIPPSIGWIKINLDGVTKGNQGCVGSGGVLRDKHGRFISTVVLPLGT